MSRGSEEGNSDRSDDEAREAMDVARAMMQHEADVRFLRENLMPQLGEIAKGDDAQHGLVSAVHGPTEFDLDRLAGHLDHAPPLRTAVVSPRMSLFMCATAAILLFIFALALPTNAGAMEGREGEDHD